jgi:hypothetical protein
MQQGAPREARAEAAPMTARTFTAEVFYCTGYYRTDVEVRAATVEEACAAAIKLADSPGEGAGWKSSDWCGPTHVLNIYDEQGEGYRVPFQYSSSDAIQDPERARLNEASPRMLAMIAKLVRTYMPPASTGVDSRSVDDVLVEACLILSEFPEAVTFDDVTNEQGA